MAAVIAAMLKACEPNGAMISEPRPVMVTIGLALVSIQALAEQLGAPPLAGTAQAY